MSTKMCLITVSVLQLLYFTDQQADAQERCCPDPYGWGICWPCPRASEIQTKGLYSAFISQL